MIEKVGFIGLGAMGFSMANKLQENGYDVYAYDVSVDAVSRAEENNITCCKTVKEVAKKADKAIITIVRTQEQTEEVIFGKEGILAAEKNDQTIIVMSTLDPSAIKNINLRLDKTGYNLIDSPVSGGPSGAAEGTLAIMMSGKKELIEDFNKFFEVMGENIFYFGDEIGKGQAVKLTNNLIAAINLTALTEGFKFGESYGLSKENILEVIKASTGDNWFAQNWDEVSEWKADDTLGAIYKDISAVVKANLKEELFLPLGTLTSQILYDSMDNIRD